MSMDAGEMQTAKRKRMFIFDPCFGGMTGHWENYCKLFCGELEKREYEVTVFGQAEYRTSIVEGVVFKPFFKTSPYSQVDSMQDLGRLAKSFLDDFKSLDDNQFHHGDILIFHSIFPHLFSAVIDWIEDLAKKNKIKAIVVFQFPPSKIKSYISRIKRAYYFARRIMNGEKPLSSNVDWADNNFVRFYQKKIPQLKKISKEFLLLVANTEVLSRNFSAILDEKVRTLPMPGIATDAAELIQTIKDNKKIKIGYFGHASLEKGGQFLQSCVEAVLKKFPHIEFVLHINPNDDVRDCLEYFKNTLLDNVKCYYGHLPQPTILRLMSEVDIILMPYSQKVYSNMPSAIFSESLPLKKVFVLPIDTWMYCEANKYDAGVAVFNDYSQHSIVEAIFEAITNYNELKRKSIIAGELFHKENNITNYIDIVEDFLERMGANPINLIDGLKLCKH